jgi:hypothetical protein
MFRASPAFVSFVSFVSLVCFVPEARAQSSDLVGVRASGMAGAFTAVADDATAAWWNPAGLAGGAYFNAILETGSHREPPTDRDATGAPAAAWRSAATGLAVAYPALGLSYYRLRVSEIRPQTSTASTSDGRQDQGTADVRLSSLVLHQFGATFGQSLGKHFVVGSTLKLVRASAGAQVRSASGASIDEAERIDGAGETHAGLDMGAIASFGAARFGLTVRNVKQPEFGTGPDAITLKRHARAGAAISSGRRGVIGSATVALDADLTTTATALGDERRAALGAEVWTPKRNFGARGGLNVNTIGDRRTSFSGGLSAAVRAGTYVDGEVTGGSDQGRRGWGVALRVTF